MNIEEIYNLLLEKFGEEGWWPTSKSGYDKNNKNRKLSADERFEICIGAILTQNTSWKNVEKAILNLKRQNLLSRDAITKISEKELALLIKSSGYYNQKAKKIKKFVNFSGEVNRENLLKVWGLGKETVDSILLYAYKKPVFVIDAYTKRIMKRIGFKEEDYDSLQELFMKNLPREQALFNEFHALFVKLGKEICKNKPDCNLCPLIKICKKNIK